MTPRFALLLVAALAGCGDSVSPFEAWTLLDLGVHLSITVDPAVVAAGDTVVFTTSAYNPTAEAVQIGRHCGPSFDVVVTAPSGTEISVLRDMLGPEVFFTCQLGPWHFVEPGETEEQVLAWKVPDQPGVYRARATLRRDDLHLSEPVQLRVE